MDANITTCTTCFQVTAHLILTGRGGSKTIPGTGDGMCSHRDTDITAVDVRALIHLALSTIIRDTAVEQSARDTAHVIQEWMKAADVRTHRLPFILVDGYGVSSTGLATARILARTVSALSAPSDAFYWSAAANVMRRKLS